MVMMYIRFPLSLRNVEDLLFEPRDRTVLVEPLRAAVCRRHPAAAGEQDEGLSSLALASRRDVLEAEW